MPVQLETRFGGTRYLELVLVQGGVLGTLKSRRSFRSFACFVFSIFFPFYTQGMGSLIDYLPSVPFSFSPRMEGLWFSSRLVLRYRYTFFWLFWFLTFFWPFCFLNDWAP